MVVQVNSGTRPLRSVLVLSAPVLLEQLLGMLVGLVDTWLTGNYLPGNDYLAAIGLMAYMLWFIPNLFSAVAIGATALTSRATGATDHELAHSASNQAFLLGAGLAAIVTLSFALGGDAFIRSMQLQDDAIPIASTYLKIIVPVIPAIMFEQIAIACLRGVGDTVTGFWAMTTVNLVNIVVSIALVSGVGPMPEMGWKGIAIGTAVGHLSGACVLLYRLKRKASAVPIRVSQMRPNLELASRILRVGIPGGLDILVLLSCHLWLLAIINSLGNDQSAAHSLVIRIESLAYLPGAAFQVAATTLAGQYLGANDSKRAKQSVILACLIGGVVMCIAGIFFYYCGEATARFFAANAEAATTEKAGRILRLVSFAMPALAVAMIVTGALRGAGDTRIPFLFNLVGMLGIRIPGAYLLTRDLYLGNLQVGFDLGLLGAWYAMIADLFIRAILALWRFQHGGWAKTNV